MNILTRIIDNRINKTMSSVYTSPTLASKNIFLRMVYDKRKSTKCNISNKTCLYRGTMRDTEVMKDAESERNKCNEDEETGLLGSP